MDELQQKQVRQAEELLFSGPQTAGFAKELFFGRFLTSAITPYPQLSAAEKSIGDHVLADLQQFLREQVDAAAIDRQADIPRDVILGLGNVGVLGATIAPEHGGRGLSQQNYCRLMEAIGGHCAATAVFVNAHHSIGLRGLELFGTPEQKKRWLRPLTTGEQIAAFALTEPDAGSDASNVQTRAWPTGDGRGYLLTGQKRYITNGAIAQVLTVMARTPDPHDPEGKITAFLVTPDMPGFEVLEARMPKCGIRGTATARLAFHEMFVPRENVLGPIGKGLRVALTVLDFGRTTFGASCTGAAKFCLQHALSHARTRRQFGKSLGEFELVKQKLAYAAAQIYAMESATYHTAALIDRKAEDYMLETAMLKVFASDALWTIVNDTLQIYGGAGYFNDQPFERMMRDARINMIGEGANDVLRSFIAMVGLRGVGLELQQLTRKPWKIASTLRFHAPRIPVLHSLLQPAAARLSRHILKFARACQVALVVHQENILNKQFVQARLGDMATELFLSSCVYSRLMSLVQQSPNNSESYTREMQAGLMYLKLAFRRNNQRLAEMSDDDDALTNRTADVFLQDHPH